MLSAFRNLSAGFNTRSGRPRDLLLGLIVFISAGCVETAPQMTNQASTKPALGYEFEVKGENSEIARGQAGSFDVQAGGNTARVVDQQLTVNDKSYGVVETGSKITVEADGSVAVNGVLQSPVESSAK